MIPTKQDLDTLYNLYDKDGSGSLDYKEFASEVFGRQIGGTPSAGAQTGAAML
jgi:hypothetical protein